MGVSDSNRLNNMQCQQMLHRRQCFGSGSHPKASTLRQAFSGGSLQQHRSRHQLQCAAAANLTGCKLVGVGSSAPSTVLSNADLEKFVETSDEWIASRTGIRRRHVLADGENMAGHAAAACKKALEMAGVAAEDVSIVLMATSTPDDAFGSACQVRRPSGRPQLAAVDSSLFVLAIAQVDFSSSQHSMPSTACQLCMHGSRKQPSTLAMTVVAAARFGRSWATVGPAVSMQKQMPSKVTAFTAPIISVLALITRRTCLLRCTDLSCIVGALVLTLCYVC